MSIGPILYDDRVIVGPLRVAPINYPDGVGGTPINDPTWATRDKDYVAFVDDEAGGQNIGFTKDSPFWSFHPFQPFNNSTKLINLEYWNCGKLQAEIVSPLDPFAASDRVQCVDGNGYIYQHWARPKSTGISYSVIRRIKRDGSMVDAVIDWQSIAPTTTPQGVQYDPFDIRVDQNVSYHQFFPSALYYILPQNDGILVQCQALIRTHYFENRPVIEIAFMWVRVGPDGSVGTPWWEPVIGVPGVGPTAIKAYAPLPNGYIGVTSLFAGSKNMFHVDDHGNITLNEAIPIFSPGITTINGALNSNTLGSPSHTVPIHRNGDLWIGQRLFDSNFNEITPQWVNGLASKTFQFIVTADQMANSEFRRISIENDSPSDSYYRVRDRFGNIKEEARRSTSLGLNDAMYGLRVQMDCFIYYREGPPFGQYGVENNGLYKFRADNFVSVPIARNRAGCWARDEFPHLDYTDWPLGTGA